MKQTYYPVIVHIYKNRKIRAEVGTGTEMDEKPAPKISKYEDHVDLEAWHVSPERREIYISYLYSGKIRLDHLLKEIS